MRTILQRLFKHFASADRLEHAGYLLVVFLSEHTAMRVVALAILGGILIVAVIAHD